jgi:hypothetical protein
MSSDALDLQHVVEISSSHGSSSSHSSDAAPFSAQSSPVAVSAPEVCPSASRFASHLARICAYHFFVVAIFSSTFLKIHFRFLPLVAGEAPFQGKKCRRKVSIISPVTISFLCRRHSTGGQDLIGCWEDSEYSIDGEGETARSTFSADKVVLDGSTFVIMFGGFNGKPLDDVMLFDQESAMFSYPKCTVKPESSPISARYSHTATVWNQKLVVFGGWSGSRCNDLHVLDCSTWEWEEIKPQQPPASMPSGRAGHTATLFGDHLVIFGGNDGELLNDLWILCLKSMLWHKTGTGGIPISGKPPYPVSSHSATKFSDQQGDFILFFGQKHEDNSIMYSHTHILRLDIRRDGPQSEAVFNIRWASVETSGTKPGMRYAHSACKLRHKLIVFGGVSIALRNDVWILDTQSWSWHRPTILGKFPLARFGHCSWLSDMRPGQMMIFGGKHRSEMLSDMFSIEFSSTVTLDKVLNQIEDTIDNFMQTELSELEKCQQNLKDQVTTACSVIEKALKYRQTKFSEDLNIIYLPMLRKSFHDAATGSKERNAGIKIQSCRVKLNVGGGLFETTSRTLCAVPGSILHDIGESASIAAANLSGASASDASDSTIFIDRSPRLFDAVNLIFMFYNVHYVL